jgi:hypothetical protein
LRSRHKPMTGHANACGRNSRVRAPFSSVMTIETGNLHFPSVLLMRKADRLLGRVTLLVPRQMVALEPTDQDERANDQPNQQNRRQKASCQVRTPSSKETQNQGPQAVASPMLSGAFSRTAHRAGVIRSSRTQRRALSGQSS